MSDEPVAVSCQIVATPDPEFETSQQEIARLLAHTNGQISAVSRCLDAGMSRREIVEAGAAANTGAVGVLVSNINAIRDQKIPQAPSLASAALSATRSFRKQHRDLMSSDALAHVDAVIDALETAANDRQAQEREEEELQAKGGELEERLALEGGVYVYTYPHYWRYPAVEGTRRTLLKVGMTTRDAAVRVRQQARLTALPEDPLLLRVYQSSAMPPGQVERAFHRLLRAADHTRIDTTAGGNEWFVTSIEFLDTIAETLNLEIQRAELDEA